MISIAICNIILFICIWLNTKSWVFISEPRDMYYYVLLDAVKAMTQMCYFVHYELEKQL